jgi:hypothetical protein
MNETVLSHCVRGTTREEMLVGIKYDNSNYSFGNRMLAVNFGHGVTRSSIESERAESQVFFSC